MGVFGSVRFYLNLLTGLWLLGCLFGLTSRASKLDWLNFQELRRERVRDTDLRLVP